MDVELGTLFASFCVAFLVLGLDAPKSAPFVSRHQVPAHECRVAIVAPEEIAFVGPRTVVVCVDDLDVVEPDHDSRLDTDSTARMRSRCELVTPPNFGECAGPWGLVVLHRPLARKLVVADRNVDAAYFMLGAGQSQWPAFRKKTKKHTTNKNKTPVISIDRPFVLLRCVSQQ